MNFEDIQAEYDLFIEHLYCAQGYLDEILRDGNKFLDYYSKIKTGERSFAEALDENLLNLSAIFASLDDITEALLNISIKEMKDIRKNNVVMLDDYIKIPDDYEQDIYVDLEYPLKWK